MVSFIHNKSRYITWHVNHSSAHDMPSIVIIFCQECTNFTERNTRNQIFPSFVLYQQKFYVFGWSSMTEKRSWILFLFCQVVRVVNKDLITPRYNTEKNLDLGCNTLFITLQFWVKVGPSNYLHLKISIGKIRIPSRGGLLCIKNNQSKIILFRLV